MGTSQNIPGMFQLIDKKTISSGSGFQTKKVAESAQILGGKLRIELVSKAIKKRREELLPVMIISSTYKSR